MTSDTVEIDRESLRLLRNEAQNLVDCIDDPEWHDSPYGETIQDAIEDANDALTRE